MITDLVYQDLLRAIYERGDELETRNHRVRSLWNSSPLQFHQTPLVTLRKTAWKKAIREMEWFMSGDPHCPNELLDWWKGQLSPRSNCYFDGYGEQLRGHGSGVVGRDSGFDQVEFILNGLRNNSNSRRLVMTCWHPYEMAHITEVNNNPNTPTTCHTTLVQFFVRKGALNMTSVQRSCDVLLGLPHNLLQSWAMLMYFAHHANLKVGAMRWVIGDAHLYLHESHIKAARELLNIPTEVIANPSSFDLIYTPSDDPAKPIPRFIANDFTMTGAIPEPKVVTRPVLL